MKLGSSIDLTNGLRVSVDWLSFTIKSETFISWQGLARYFGLPLNQFNSEFRGSYGYKKSACHMFYNVKILYDGLDGMGIHVDISGSAVGFFLQCYLNRKSSETPFDCPAFEITSEISAFNDVVLCSLLKDILDKGGQISRLDLAVDDIGCTYYSLAELRDIFHDGLYVSKFRKYKEVFESDKISCTGSTIYLGSPKSEMMIRIYDKQLEQNSAKKANIQTPWTRWEIQLRKERATVASAVLASGSALSSVTLGILSNYLRIIVRDNVRDTRCSSDSKWIAFLDGIKKLRISQPVREKTLDDKRAWLMKQVAPTLAAIHRYDNDLSFVYTLLKSGSMRISGDLVQMLQKSPYWSDILMDTGWML